MSKRKPSLQFLKTAILKVLQNHPKSLNNKQISWAINLKGSEYQKVIARSIKELKKEGLIIESSKYKYQKNLLPQKTQGVLEINNAKHGYVSSKLYSDDIFINKADMLNALNGDTVSVKIVKNNRNKIAGKVVDVIRRNQSKFIGFIQELNNDLFFYPDNMKVGSVFFIDASVLGGAKSGDRVIVKLIDWPLSSKYPLGSVVSILPKKHSLKDEINTTIQLFNIRTSFNDQIVEEVKQINTEISVDELKLRKDFREKNTFTIDPEDAKDFDDAISIKSLDSGAIEVGIHIADVGHYVPINSMIDKEALLRAFSIYFPGRVIPMLPEKLSNKICSLNPNEDKLCFSVVVEFDDKLEAINSTWIGKTIIRSNKRFTYAEAETLINNDSNQKFNTDLIELNEIAKKLRKNRITNGSIDFERNEMCFELNKNKEPVRIIEKKSLSAHKLVEEFMLLANKIVASKLSNYKQSIYRVHDLPDKEKLNEVMLFLGQVKKVQVSLNVNHKKLHKVINQLIDIYSPFVEKSIIINLILRAMAKASYSTKNIGHYGLGFSQYTHFTSPIRRYSDLIIHRLLASLIYKKEPPLVLNLEKKCRYFSKTEKLYVDIERKTTKFIQLMLLEKSVGVALNGIITGLVKWGIYVNVEGGKGEGLVHAKELINYFYNDVKRAFIHRKSGKKYILGQSINIEIKSINLFKQEMDLKIIE